MPIDAISALLAFPSPAAECADVAAWWPRWQRLAAAHLTQFGRAVAGGADADRLGWAFASGYQAAQRWARDRRLFGVAAKARVQRLAAAWSRLDAREQSA